MNPVNQITFSFQNPDSFFGFPLMMKSSDEETFKCFSHDPAEGAHVLENAWARGRFARWRLQHQHRSTSSSSCPQHLSLSLSPRCFLPLREREGERRRRWWWKHTLVHRPKSYVFDQHSSINRRQRSLEVSRTPCGCFFGNDASQASIGSFEEVSHLFCLRDLGTAAAAASQFVIRIWWCCRRPRRRDISEWRKSQSLFLQEKKQEIKCGSWSDCVCSSRLQESEVRQRRGGWSDGWQVKSVWVILMIRHRLSVLPLWSTVMTGWVWINLSLMC